MDKQITLIEAMKKFKRKVAEDKYCVLRVTITAYRKSCKTPPAIRWQGYIDGYSWSQEHLHLNGVIKNLQDQINPNVEKGQDAKI